MKHGVQEIGTNYIFNQERKSFSFLFFIPQYNSNSVLSVPEKKKCFRISKNWIKPVRNVFLQLQNHMPSFEVQEMAFTYCPALIPRVTLRRSLDNDVIERLTFLWDQCTSIRLNTGRYQYVAWNCKFTITNNIRTVIHNTRTISCFFFAQYKHHYYITSLWH